MKGWRKTASGDSTVFQKYERPMNSNPNRRIIIEIGPAWTAAIIIAGVILAAVLLHIH